MVPLPDQDKGEGEVIDLVEDIRGRDLVAHGRKTLGEGHEDYNHQRKEMEVDEPEVEVFDPVEHLEIKEPEHAEYQEGAGKIDDLQDDRDKVEHKGGVGCYRACRRRRDVPDHQGHRERVDAVCDPFQVHLADRVHTGFTFLSGKCASQGIVLYGMQGPATRCSGHGW